MNNQEFVEKVNVGQFPLEIRVPLDPPFVDDRGEIQNLWLGPSGSVTLISSKKGSVRAQHRHPAPILNTETGKLEGGDWHSIHVLSGSLEYREGNINDLRKHLVHPGEMIFTPPEVYHEVEAIEDTTFLTINGILKNHGNYESGIKRGPNDSSKI